MAKLAEFKNRADQVRSFARLVRAGKESLPSALRSAAMVGACEERDRTLGLIRATKMLDPATKNFLETLITSEGVLDVLGYRSKT